MKILAILLILLGPIIVVGSVRYAHQESTTRQDAWHRTESETALQTLDAARAQRHWQMIQEGLVPAWTVVDPWPGMLVGIGCSAFGILLLAIRRPISKGKPCSFCAELIRPDASVCRFCGRAVGPIRRPVSQDGSTERTLWSRLARGRQAVNNVILADRPQPIPKATATAPPPWEKKP